MGLGKQVKNGHQTTKSSAKNASEQKHRFGMPKATTWILTGCSHRTQ